jgi:hypothetical protein
MLENEKTPDAPEIFYTRSNNEFRIRVVKHG